MGLGIGFRFRVSVWVKVIWAEGIGFRGLCLGLRC